MKKVWMKLSNSERVVLLDRMNVDETLALVEVPDADDFNRRQPAKLATRDEVQEHLRRLAEAAGLTGTHGSLPDGSDWYASERGWRAAWRCWRELVARALRTGEGVSVRVQQDGEVTFATTYSALYHGEQVSVWPDGRVTHHGEQSSSEEAVVAATPEGLPWDARQ